MQRALVVAIAAGDYHSLALKSDGTVVAWGLNDHGQITVPGNLGGVFAIAAGAVHSVALVASPLRIDAITVKTDGVQLAWSSAMNKLYSVQRSTDLAAGFTNIAEHVLSTPPENTYVDLSATNNTPVFYRIKAE